MAGRGDVVVLYSPYDGKRLIKRVVAIPGDRIEMKDHRLIVNGVPAGYEPLDAASFRDVEPENSAFRETAPNASPRPILTTPSRPSMASFGPVELPPGRFWVMGDNRDNSFDSRWFGLVERTRILGRATAVVLSLDINDSFIFTDGDNDSSELTWDLSGVYEFGNGMSMYGTIQNGYQSGQFPPRPFCLFGWFFGGAPYCFLANDNVTAQNYEFGFKGQPFDNLEMSIALFYTDYSDLPYQVSTTSGAGFTTVNIIVDQVSQGIEWEGTWAISDNFRLHSTLGYIDADVKDPNPAAVAPLTPELTASLSPELSFPTGNGEVILRADWSYRDEMFGEPSSDPGRFTRIDSRNLVNFDFSYRSENGGWTAGIYGRNVTDERYDNARLNTGDYVLIMLSNDASEFGVRFTKEF